MCVCVCVCVCKYASITVRMGGMEAKRGVRIIYFFLYNCDIYNRNMDMKCNENIPKGNVKIGSRGVIFLS